MSDRKRPSGRKAVSLSPIGLPATVVADPDSNGTVTVRRRVDILDLERAHKRISEAAFRAGCVLQHAFEKSGHSLNTNWRRDITVDTTAVRLERAERVVDDVARTIPLFRDVRLRLGVTDAALVRLILGERLSFTQCAEVTGRNGERSASYLATRFRDALEHLADAWAAHGPRRQAANDVFAHLAATKLTGLGSLPAT